MKSSDVPDRITKSKSQYRTSYDFPDSIAATLATLPPAERVLGVFLNGEAKAYPIYLLQKCHVANDIIGGQPVLLVYCGSCGSGLTFCRTLADRRPAFEVYGLHKGRVAIRDRESKTLWDQEGNALEGLFSGHHLKPLASSHLTWLEWRDLYPATTIVESANISRHRPPKMRHMDDGPRPSRPQKDPNFLLGLHLGSEARGYTFTALGSTMRVVHDVVSGQAVAVFWNAASKSGNAFRAEVDGQLLKFEVESEQPFIVKDHRAERWNFAGQSLDEPGRRLTPLPLDRIRANSWHAAHPASRTWQDNGEA